MKLDEAIAEVKYWHERGRYWPGEPATVAEVIITAAASGDLIPSAGLFSSAKTYTEAEVKLAVALAYQRAGEVAKVYVRRAMHLHPDGYEIERRYGLMAKQADDAILALADSDPLAEVQALKAELREARMQALADLGQAQEAWEAQKAAEAEVVRLREALTRIEGKDSWIDASIRSDGPERKVMRGEFGEIARAALSAYEGAK